MITFVALNIMSSANPTGNLVSIVTCWVSYDQEIYKKFDKTEGRDVALNPVELRNFSEDSSGLKRLF